MENLCVTRDAFTSWDEARDHCVELGGDLAVPERTASDMQDLIQVSVWAGGRATRVWVTGIQALALKLIRQK